MLTPEGRHHVPDPGAAAAAELPQTQLQEVEGSPDEQQNKDVGDEEGSPAVGVGNVREPPDVAEPHRHGDTGQEELEGAGPLLPLRLLPLPPRGATVGHDRVQPEEGDLGIQGHQSVVLPLVS